MSDICMFGLSKSGKTSIIKVIFQKMNALQTYMLDPTPRMDRVPITMGPYIKFNILDFSGNNDLKDLSPPEITALENCGVMIFVLDIQVDSYVDAIKYLIDAIQVMQKRNANCLYHVFIHKVNLDQLAVENKKYEMTGQIRDMINEELNSANMKSITIDYHMTTIYDHCLFEQFSKVIQKIIPQVQSIQFLLDQMNVYCKIEKSFLFEIVSKLYIASDTTPIDLGNFQLCSEMIDVFIDISFIYGQANYEINYFRSQNQAFQGNQSSAIIKLSDGTILLFKEVEKFLALICIIKQENYDRPFLVDFNIDVFSEGLMKLFKLKEQIK